MISKRFFNIEISSTHHFSKLLICNSDEKLRYHYIVPCVFNAVLKFLYIINIILVRSFMSKFGNLVSDPDPDKVVILKKHVPTNKTLKTQAEISAAQRRGEKLDTTKKYFAGSNRQNKLDINTARLDEETEELKHEHVPLELGKIIQQARAAKEWNQKVIFSRNHLTSLLGFEYPHQ